MHLKPDTAYRVTKENSDGCVLIGDLIYLDSVTGYLVFCDGTQGGWLEPDELTPEIMDFEAKAENNYVVRRQSNGRTWVEKKKEEESA